MSFGSSVGDCILLAQLAWNTYEGARKACGEHDELTREVSSLYRVLNRLRQEIANPESQVNKASNDKQQELEEHAAGCEGILRTMNNVLAKYNALTGEQRRGKRLWQKIRFGNGQTKNLAEIRIKLSTHTSAIMMSLNLCSLDSMGRVEEMLGRVEARSTNYGEQLHGIRKALHWVTANMAAASGEGSVWTSYTNDDQLFWRELRRELAKEGYRSSTLQRHKSLIKDYVEELGNRGVFDDIIDLEEAPDDADEEMDEKIINAKQSISGSGTDDMYKVRHSHGALNLADTSVHSGTEVRAEDSETSADKCVNDLAFAGKLFEVHNKSEHWSDMSHVISDTAGQDENALSEIPPITTVNNGDAIMASDKVSPELNSIVGTKSAVNLDEVYLDFSGSEASEGDGSGDAPEDDEVVEEIKPPDRWQDLEIERSSMSGNDTHQQGLFGSNGISSSRFLSPAPTPNENTSMLTNVVKDCATSDDLDSSYSNSPVVPLQRIESTRSPYAVCIEEVLDEEFSQHLRSDVLEEWHTATPISDVLTPSTNVHYDPPLAETGIGESSSTSKVGLVEKIASDSHAVAPPPVSAEDVLDEDFLVDAHPNVSTTDAVFDFVSDSGATLAWRDSERSSEAGSKPEKKPVKSVRFAHAKSDGRTFAAPVTKWAAEDLRFIFYRETRDFNSYQELQESYQAFFDESQGGYNSIDLNRPEDTTNFITHSPYTPPATMYDLQYYRVPASYFHTFWHPQRVPIYLHGNVFDGISLTNWIYNWTTYTFPYNSYQMDAVRRLGKTVVKLGSALSDIERAKPAVKASLPKDLYDESGVLWADLENIINDIMSEAEDRLELSVKGGRLEIEFVSMFCQELIAGQKYYRSLERFLRKTEAWCKKVRFHPDFIMLWELWES